MSSIAVVKLRQMKQRFVPGGTKHWEQTRSPSEETAADTWRAPYSQSRSVDIEMTAYGLLVHCLSGDVSDAVPIAKWIIAQRNPNGGFSSTQVRRGHSVMLSSHLGC